MKANLTRRTAVGVTLLAVAGLVMAACGTSKPATAPSASGSWPYPNGDIANTRDAAGSTISVANVSKLAQAWTFKLTGRAAAGGGGTGSLAVAPIVQNGVVYPQDLDSNVYALALATGRLTWEYLLNLPKKSGPGPNGVAVVDGTVYGASPTTVFALNATTGHKIWVNNNLLSKGQGTFGIQPQVADGRIYLVEPVRFGARRRSVVGAERVVGQGVVEIQYGSDSGKAVKRRFSQM
jgi:outer membrane protein assembly factor BamB